MVKVKLKKVLATLVITSHREREIYQLQALAWNKLYKKSLFNKIRYQKIYCMKMLILFVIF